MNPESSNKSTIGQLVGLVAALFVLLCFFLPWIELNLLIVSAQLSGYQLATGSGPAGASYPGVPSLLLLPLGMLVVVGIVSLKLIRKDALTQLERMSPLILIGVGVLSAGVLLYQYFNLNAELNRDVFGFVAQQAISYSFGAGASLFGTFLVIVGGVIDLRSVTATRIGHPDEGRQL